MKILQLTNKFPYPEKDGGAIACMNMLKGFFELGHKVSVLSMSTKKHQVVESQIPEDVKKLATFYFVNVEAEISVVGAVLNLLFSKLPYNAERFIDGAFEKKLTELLLANQYDVIQLEGLYLCPYISIIKKYSKASIAYRAHNIEYEVWERTASLAHGIKKWYLKLLSSRIKQFEISFINAYDILVPISSRDASLLDKLGNTKPKIVSQTGIDAQNYIPDQQNIEFPSVFHIGSLDWAPNQEGLLWFLKNCWPTLVTNFPELKFYVAGRNTPAWLREKLTQTNVVVLGEVEDARQFINSKAIMIVPLFSGSGMRIKIIEGMALAKPIVSTSIGTEGIATTTGENIIVADSGNEFIEAVTALINNKPYFEKISGNARTFVTENFNNLGIVKKLAEFYQNHL